MTSDQAVKPGRIRVLLRLGAQEPLRASAMAAAVGYNTGGVDLRQTRVPAGFEIDPTFPAVPVGRGSGLQTTADADPRATEHFIVRGFISVEDVNTIPVELEGNRIFSSPAIEPVLTCVGMPAVGSTSDVKKKLRLDKLGSYGLDGEGVAVAIVDTGINIDHLLRKLGAVPLIDFTNSWKSSDVDTSPGRHPVGHGTMCAYNVLTVAPKATLLDIALLLNSAPAGSIAAKDVGTAMQVYSMLLAKFRAYYGPGDIGARYKSLVINNSWAVYHPSWDFPLGHPGRYIDNPEHAFHGQVSLLASQGVDIIFAAGNCGAPCPDGKCQGRTEGSIMGASAYREVLTVAGCDVNDTRVGYSSTGPSIENMPQQKPDLTAYTHFLGSEAFGVGQPDTGTSTACPIVAGSVAALRTKAAVDMIPPRSLFEQLCGTTRKVGFEGAWDPGYGSGIIDPVLAAQTLGIAVERANPLASILSALNLGQASSVYKRLTRFWSGD